MNDCERTWELTGCRHVYAGQKEAYAAGWADALKRAGGLVVVGTEIKAEDEETLRLVALSSGGKL